MSNRIANEFSLHPEHKKELCKRGSEHCGNWRVVECCEQKEGRDIVECSKCGEQRSVRCNFDEDNS